MVRARHENALGNGGKHVCGAGWLRHIHTHTQLRVHNSIVKTQVDPKKGVSRNIRYIVSWVYTLTDLHTHTSTHGQCQGVTVFF